MHFWCGYNCLLQKDSQLDTPRAVAVSDVIKIASDLQNRIPDRSWMLYLLEIFNRQGIPIELDLICSFNDDGKFHAIFGGRNRYEFKVRPVVGHSYLRQIVMEPHQGGIRYLLMDEVSGQTDSFLFKVEGQFDYQISRLFTGLEWHNKTGNLPFSIPYEVEVSNLAYGLHDDPSDPRSVAYLPYNQLTPDSEGLGKEYPVLFGDFGVRNGFITYRIGPGKQGTAYM
ncbi:MAG: hypothetical protein KGI33_07275 [Thaumarchaeota archaeon]|nr:hypothetical protein [Nitrososphaerota archaeon]